MNFWKRLFKSKIRASEATLTKASVATALAFQHAAAARILPAEEPYLPFNTVAYVWGAKHLYRGTKEAIRALVDQNLERISRESGFHSFRVFMRDDSVVQISALFADFFIAVQLWRAGQEYFTNGNSDFRPNGALASDKRIRSESGEKDESEQRQRILKLQKTGVRLQHSLCGQEFAVSDCRISRVEDASVIFWCPKCQIQAVHSLI